MLTKIDKAWVAALVSFASLSAMQFFGIEINEQVQAGIVSVVTALMVYIVPNKTA